ncbi:MAG: oligosaccharide flippase family protein [Microscillaceae bacterium]|nr:oligosaccharide flippase family protein [Microscillaceae bacterium]
MFIGRYIGKVTLGYYNRAHLMVFLPAYYLHQSLSTVLFPAFSKLQNQRERLKEVYQDAVSLSGFVLIPVCAGLAIAAPECIYVILGPKWHPSIPILQFLCFIVPFNLLASYAGMVCDATNVMRQKILFNIFLLVMMLLAFYFSRSLGIYAFLSILFIRDFLKTLFFSLIMKKIFHITFLDIFKPYLPGLVHGLFTALGIILVTYFGRYAGINIYLLLGMQILTGCISLLGQMFFFHNIL